jgi:lysophospholipase L1-like esterase
MKYTFKIIFIILLIVSCYAQNETRRRFLTYYEQKKSTFELLPNGKNEIIFLGNSITEGCEWNELFSDNRIINRGISADVAEGILLRLNEVTESKPLKVFLMIGINDLAFGYTIEEIVNNYTGIIEKIKNDSPKTKTYIQSVLPINDSFGEFSIYDTLSNSIIQLNNELEKLAKDNNFVYINLHDSFLLNNRLNPNYTNDGLHLTGKGYILWKKLIKKYIKE